MTSIYSGDLYATQPSGNAIGGGTSQGSETPFYGFGDDLSMLYSNDTPSTGGILSPYAAQPRQALDDTPSTGGILSSLPLGYSGQLMPTQAIARERHDIMYGAPQITGFNPFFGNGLTQGQAAAAANTTATTTTQPASGGIASLGFTGINPFIQNTLSEAQQKAQSVGMAEGGLAGLTQNAIYPQSQMDKTQYATPTQMPTSAEVIDADYDPKTNAYTGMPMARFAKGGYAVDPDALKHDPNNFASDVVKAYETLFGRKPTNEELVTNVDALNHDRDAYAWMVRTMSDSPEVDQAIKEGKVDLTPRTVMSGEGEIEVPGKDAAVEDLIGGYGKFTPTPEPGGFQGFMNKAGPYLPFVMAAAAMAAPAIGAAAAGEGAATGAALGAGEAAGGGAALGAGEVAAGSGSWGLTPELAAELGLDYSTTGLSGAGASGDVLAGMGVEGAAGSGSWGLSPELAQELGLDYSTSGLTDLSGKAGSATLESMGLNTAGGGLTAKQAFAAKTLLDTASNIGGGSGYGGTGPSSTTTPLIFRPNAGISSIPNIPMMGGQQYGQLYDTRSNTYKYFPEGYARGGIASLGSYSDGGHLLKGPGDGMSDHIPATIGDKQPARLADGEFVIPADVVSHLGNGSTDAGAKQLYKMMDKVRQARTGRKSQGKQIDPNKFLLKG